MESIILILKALLVLLVNTGFGYLISTCFHFFFFNPRKIVLFKRYHLPLTPGLVYRKKKHLMDYLHKLVNDYFEYANRDYREKNILSEYENRVFIELFPLVCNFFERGWIPEFLQGYLHEFIQKTLWTAIRKFSRTILPRFLCDWHIYTKLDLLDLKLDVKFIESYFNEYFYKYFLYFNIFFLSIVGVLNMVMFLILA